VRGRRLFVSQPHMVCACERLGARGKHKQRQRLADPGPETRAFCRALRPAGPAKTPPLAATGVRTGKGGAAVLGALWTGRQSSVHG